MSQFPDLEACKEPPWFSFDGVKITGVCVRVVDGDTVYVVVDVPGFGHRRLKLRLDGIDTPELRSKLPNEKKLADLAKTQVIEMIQGKPVSIECGKFDNFGRVLAHVYEMNAETSVNQLLVKRGLALSYSGRKKDAEAMRVLCERALQ